MKKIIFLTIAMLAFAGLAMAANTAFNADTPLSATPTGGVLTEIIKPSNNVNGKITSAANRFAAVTAHLNGTYEYATSSTDTKIYRKLRPVANKGTTTIVLSLTASDTSNFSDSTWIAL